MSDQLNPKALEAAARALNAVHYPDISADCAWNMRTDDGRDEVREEAAAAVSAYLAATVDPRSSPQGHYDAWLDTGDGYTQRKGWTLSCLWCDREFVGATKAEALKGYHAHEEEMRQELRRTDANRSVSLPGASE
ncbi:hypothetical protein [Glutamicibacter sp. X7]